MATLFIYETLLDETLLQQLLNHPVVLTPFTISGLKEVSKNLSSSKTNYHTLVRSVGSKAKGAVFEASDEDIQILDDWEEEYTRIELKMKSGLVVEIYILPFDL